MAPKSRFDTTANSTDFFGLIEIWNITKDYQNVLNYSNTKNIPEKDLLSGYIYFIETCLRALLNEIVTCRYVELQSNYEFYRAKHQAIHISRLSSSCETLTFIRNYSRKLRKLKKSKNSDELIQVIHDFDELISSLSKNLREKTEKNPAFNISTSERERFSAISRGLILFNQCEPRPRPRGYFFGLLDNSFSEYQAEKYLLGYKITLLYLWRNLLDDEHFKKIEGLEFAIDWNREYYSRKYIRKHPKEFEEKKEEIANGIFTSLSITVPGKTIHDFFRPISVEIVDQLNEKYGVAMVMDAYFLFKEKIERKVFTSFLEDSEPRNRSTEHKIDELFLWYGSEVLDSAKRDIFNGQDAFMTVLEGAVSLKNRFRPNTEIQVLKIPHKIEDNKHDYSYGVLIESRGTMGSDWSGWMMFFDICGDYSGFSGQQHAQIEALIRIHLQRNNINLREMEIPKKELEKYLSRSSTLREIGPDKTHHERRKKQLDEARGLLVELLTFYVQTYFAEAKIEWGFENEHEGDIDIIVEKENSIKYIECKLSPATYNIEQEITKIRSKKENHPSRKEKQIEFWFWSEPTPSQSQTLDDEEIPYHILSSELENIPTLHSKADKLLFALEDDTYHRTYR